MGEREDHLFEQFRVERGCLGYIVSSARRAAIIDPELEMVEPMLDFVFEHGCGPRRWESRSMYPRVRRQVGNAVPPPAAAIMVTALADVLAQAGLRPRTARELAAARRTPLNLGEGTPSAGRASGQ